MSTPASPFGHYAPLGEQQFEGQNSQPPLPRGNRPEVGPKPPAPGKRPFWWQRNKRRAYSERLREYNSWVFKENERQRWDETANAYIDAINSAMDEGRWADAAALLNPLNSSRLRGLNPPLITRFGIYSSPPVGDQNGRFPRNPDREIRDNNEIYNLVAAAWVAEANAVKAQNDADREYWESERDRLSQEAIDGASDQLLDDWDQVGPWREAYLNLVRNGFVPVTGVPENVLQEQFVSREEWDRSARVQEPMVERSTIRVVDPHGRSTDLGSRIFGHELEHPDPSFLPVLDDLLQHVVERTLVPEGELTQIQGQPGLYLKSLPGPMDLPRGDLELLSAALLASGRDLTQSSLLLSPNGTNALRWETPEDYIGRTPTGGGDPYELNSPLNAADQARMESRNRQRTLALAREIRESDIYIPRPAALELAEARLKEDAAARAEVFQDLTKLFGVDAVQEMAEMQRNMVRRNDRSVGYDGPFGPRVDEIFDRAIATGLVQRNDWNVANVLAHPSTNAVQVKYGLPIPDPVLADPIDLPTVSRTGREFNFGSGDSRVTDGQRAGVVDRSPGRLVAGTSGSGRSNGGARRRVDDAGGPRVGQGRQGPPRPPGRGPRDPQGPQSPPRSPGTPVRETERQGPPGPTGRSRGRVVGALGLAAGTAALGIAGWDHLLNDHGQASAARPTNSNIQTENPDQTRARQEREQLLNRQSAVGLPAKSDDTQVRVKVANIMADDAQRLVRAASTKNYAQIIKYLDQHNPPTHTTKGVPDTVRQVRSTQSLYAGANVLQAVENAAKGGDAARQNVADALDTASWTVSGRTGHSYLAVALSGAANDVRDGSVSLPTSEMGLKSLIERQLRDLKVDERGSAIGIGVDAGRKISQPSIDGALTRFDQTIAAVDSLAKGDLKGLEATKDTGVSR